MFIHRRRRDPEYAEEVEKQASECFTLEQAEALGGEAGELAARRIAGPVTEMRLQVGDYHLCIVRSGRRRNALLTTGPGSLGWIVGGVTRTYDGETTWWCKTDGGKRVACEFGWRVALWRMLERQAPEVADAFELALNNAVPVERAA